jgi:iron complex outermembrane receptor protein
LAFAVGATIVSNFESDGRFARARALACTCIGPRWLRSKATPLSLLALLSSAATPSPAQTATQPDDRPVGPVIVTEPKSKPAQPGQSEAARPRARAHAAGHNPKPTAKPAPGPTNAANEVARTPLNLNAVATSASRLGLPILQTPATVEIVDQQTMREQGYRTTTETAQGAVGVLSGDSAGAPAGFSMRGFTYGEVNVLYNGIWIGPQDITSRIMDTSNLDRVEFLKGPSSLMSGLNAIGGSVNYVTQRPTTGPIKSELDTSLDSLGTYRTHFGSGGSTNVDGLDYRFDISQSKVNSFIDGDYQNLTNFSGQLNYRVTESFKVLAAIEYKQDEGHAYWGTPLVPTSFAGPFATHGVVSGFAINTFDGSLLGPLTVDSRTLTTNYNVADNSTGARELWLRSGFEWKLSSDLTIKDQVYDYNAQRHWYDSETYAFDTGTVPGDLGTNTIDRDRFFVTHHQQVYGNNADLTWDSRFFGIENRLAAQLQVSRNYISFAEEGNPNTYPYDTVSVLGPAPGLYGVPEPDIRNSRLDTVAVSIEDRLKITPMLALIGGVRLDDFSLTRDGVNFDGTIPAGQPFATTWLPVSYRAAYTFEPVRDLVFYSMYATAFDPAAAGIFSITPGTSLALTSSRIYETGVKQSLWGGKAEWTFSAYDIDRNNVYVQINDTTSTLAGEIKTKGIELAGAVRPVDNFKLWGNIALTEARYANFDFDGGSWTGNTPSNVAPIIINAGASYRFSNWRWPVEIGGSVRHVGNRYLFEDDLTTMDAYTTADLYAFVDIPGRDLPWTGVDKMRVTFRVRNVTNALYAAWSDPGYPDQVLLGTPRTFELSASTKW